LKRRSTSATFVRAAASAAEFVKGKSFADYTADVMLRSALERQLEIVGEALAQLARTDLSTASQISEYHGLLPSATSFMFAEIDHRIVWIVLETKLPGVRQEAETRLTDKKQSRAAE